MAGQDPAARRDEEGRVRPRIRRRAPAWAVRGPSCEGYPIQDISRDLGDGDALRRRGFAVVRPDGLPERRPWRDVDPVERRAHVRRRRPEDQRRLERDRGPWSPSTRGSVQPGCSGATTAAGRGPTSRASRTIPPARRGSRAPAGSSSTRSSRTRPIRAGCGWRSRRSARSRRATAGATWEPRNDGVRADFLPGSAPGDRPVRPQARHGGRRPGAALPAEPLRPVPLVRRRADLAGHLGRPAQRVRLPDGRPPARPRLTAWVIPLTPPEEGRLMPDGQGRGLADQRRGRQLAPRRRGAAPA